MAQEAQSGGQAEGVVSQAWWPGDHTAGPTSPARCHPAARLHLRHASWQPHSVRGQTAEQVVTHARRVPRWPP